MKTPIRAKKHWLIYNIPIFSVALLIIFLGSDYFISASCGGFYFLCGLTAVYFLLMVTRQWARRANQVAKRANWSPFIFSLFILIHIFFFNFALQVPLLISPNDTFIKPALFHELPLLLNIGLLTLAIFTEIYQYHYYTLQDSGTLSETTEYLFNTQVNNKIVATIDIFTGFTIQTFIVLNLSLVVLILSYSLCRLSHISYHTGMNWLILLFSYCFIMIIKVPHYERFLGKLSSKGFTAGHFYLLSALLMTVLWFIINALLSLFPASFIKVSHPYLTLSGLNNINAWFIYLLAYTLNLSFLLATVIVRLQKNSGTIFNIPLTVLLMIILHYLTVQALLNHPLVIVLSILLSSCLILFSCLFIQGNQINQIGFLPNSKRLKIKRPLKALIPSLQSINIMVILFCVMGIYTLTFMLYLASFPFIIIAFITMILFPLLVIKRQYHEKG